MGTLRFYLALSVCLNHFLNSPGNVARLSLIPDSLFAVEVFFTISGFYMAMVLNEKYTGTGSLWRFYKSRVLRIFPTYYVILFLFLALSIALRLSKGHWVFLAEAASIFSRSDAATQVYAVLSNMFFVGQDAMFLAQYSQSEGGLCINCMDDGSLLLPWQMLIIPQSWSVELELIFYVFAPFLCRLPTRVLMAAIACILIAKFVVMSNATSTGYWGFRFPPFEMAMFLSGIVSYRLYKVISKYWFNNSVIVFHIILLYSMIILSGLLESDAVKTVVTALLLPVCMPFVFMSAKHNTFDRMIGELSYPIYLVHFMVFQMVLYWYKGPYHVAFAVAMVLAVSYALFRFVSKPLEIFRQPRADPADGFSLNPQPGGRIAA